MKKLLIIVLLVAAIYPYANRYYQDHYAYGGNADSKSVSEFIDKLNSDLPRKQGLLSFNSAVEATGSVIFLVVDSMGDASQITKTEAQERLNTWTPFLIDQTCRNTTLSSGLKKGIINNVYYQISIRGGQTSYGKVAVLREMCT